MHTINLRKFKGEIENISFIHDHNLNRSVLGFCVVALGLFTGQKIYPSDFAYRFGKKCHPKSPDEKIGDPRIIKGSSYFDVLTSTICASTPIQGCET
jgi:hypothetical protein